jgi:hypothetical protein
MMSRPFAATKTNNNNKTVPGGNVTFYLYTLRSWIYIVASGARAIAAGRETRKRNTRCTHARTSPINVCSSQILRIFLSEGLKKKNNLQQLAGGGARDRSGSPARDMEGHSVYVWSFMRDECGGIFKKIK